MRRASQSSRSMRGWIAGAAALLVLSVSPIALAGSDSANDDPWAAVDSAQDFGQDEERIIGRVVGVSGTVYAQTPGEARRLLTENAPIYPGDRIITARGAQLGVLSGEYYTGLNEDTTLTYAKRGSSAPEVVLERGDVRMINAGEGANAQIATPGMVAQAGAADTSAYAVKEKAWMVSIVCALEGQVTVADGAGRSLVVEEGGCAASKPAEGLFLAGAAKPGAAVAGTPITQPLAAAGGAAKSGSTMLDPSPRSSAADDEPIPVAGAAAKRFPNPDVGAPGSFALFNARAPISAASDPLSILQPCDSPASGCLFTVPVNPPPFPPFNGWVGGNLPP